MAMRSFRFNHLVGADMFEVVMPDGTVKNMLNIICWGTNYQQVSEVVGQKTPLNTARVFHDTWTRHYGMPHICVVDRGSEFKAEFQDRLQEGGCLVHVVDVRSP